METGGKANAPVDSGSFTWQFFAGETPIAQLKTVLACIGALAIFFYGTRVFAGTAAKESKASAKRAKK